jgi:hypothetical protein
MCNYQLRGIKGIALVLGTGASEQTFCDLITSQGLVDATEELLHRRIYFYANEEDPRIPKMLDLYDNFGW